MSSQNVFIPTLDQAQTITAQYGSPVFVTDKQTIVDRVQTFKKSFSKQTKIFYAVKANFNPHVLSVLKEAGVDGIDTVSPYEIALAKQCGFAPTQIIFTGNASSDQELKEVMQHEVLCNIGSISELERFGRLFNGADVSLRLNPGVGDGENQNVITGGQDSKFGIIQRDMPIAKALLSKYNLQLKGIHCHIGSGFYETDVFAKAVYLILEQAATFANLDFIDFGGGFGVRYQRSKDPINVPSFGNAIVDMVKNFEARNGKPIEIRFEPGKYLVSEATCLLSSITTRKSTEEKDFVCIDTGFHHLIRPALYGSTHEIINLSKTVGKKERVTVVGNVCESTDVFADNIELIDPNEGDIVAILSAGAYGASMSSVYNLRPYAAEVIVDGDAMTLTRAPQSFDLMFKGLGFTQL
ncbi:MAG: diaminopimelate decarboxylase [Bdellovibrionota bacterium]